MYNEGRERDTRVSSPNAPFFLNVRLCYFQALAENNGDMIGMGFFWKREQGTEKGVVCYKRNRDKGMFKYILVTCNIVTLVKDIAPFFSPSPCSLYFPGGP